MVSHNAYLNVNIATMKPGEQSTWDRWHPGEPDPWQPSAWEATQHDTAWQHDAWPASAWQPEQHQAWPTSAWQSEHACEPTQVDTAWEPTQENPYLGATTHHQGK